MVLNKKIQFIRPRRNGREPSNWPVDGCGVPLRVTRYIPMKLKEVTPAYLEKGAKKESSVFCIEEMMSVFECYEKHEFRREPCENFVQALEHCFSTNMDRRIEAKMRRKELLNKNKK